jgi:hypothetical protein
LSRRDIAVLTEQLAQVISRAIIRQITHIQILAHRRPLRATRLSETGHRLPLAATGKIKAKSATAKPRHREQQQKLPDSFLVPREQTDLTVAEERHRI